MVDMNEINYEWVFLTPYLKKKIREGRKRYKWYPSRKKSL
jgi:hypothetical protein